MRDYKILIHADAYEKARRYLAELGAEYRPGGHLSRYLNDQDLSSLSTETFIELLLRTKRPQIFAEGEVCGDGSDWNLRELSILGDIGIAALATAFDDGRHAQPRIHDSPFEATLLFTPGALLRNGTGNTPADWDEATREGTLDREGYYRLYERRMLPLFRYAHDSALRNGNRAFITIPGIGCGQFAGEFAGRLGGELKGVLKKLIEDHGRDLSGIRGVYFDPYRECDNERHEIHDIRFLVRPLTRGNAGKSQLCEPDRYEEPGDDFSDCELFSFVAWDHVSWPGNDFYIGSRATDDGVKAAATSVMATMTGVEGVYDPGAFRYQPPFGYRNWAAVVSGHNLRIEVHDRLILY